MAEADLTAARARELLHYDPESGIFTWKERHRRYFKTHRSYSTWNATFASKPAGHETPRTGYVVIEVEQRTYRAHRLAWLYVTGYWPTDHIDHANGLRADNRWKNLRSASARMNSENRHEANAGSASGFLGVTWHAARGKWQAEITVNGRKQYLGLFNDASEAHGAYLSAKRALHQGCTI